MRPKVSSSFGLHKRKRKCKRNAKRTNKLYGMKNTSMSERYKGDDFFLFRSYTSSITLLTTVQTYTKKVLRISNTFIGLVF